VASPNHPTHCITTTLAVATTVINTISGLPEAKKGNSALMIQGTGSEFNANPTPYWLTLS